MSGNLHETDIVIAGGGLAGLTAALTLAQNGLRVINIAPAATREDRRTTALLASSVQFLEAGGVWEMLRPKAAALAVMRIIDATGRLVRAPQTDFHASEIGLEAFGYNIENAEMTKILRDTCLSHGVHFIDDSVSALETGQGGVSIGSDEGAQIRARLCVGADGRGSAIRKFAGFGEREWRYDQTAIVLNFSHEYSHENTSTEFHTPNGPFTVVPLGEKLSSLVWVDRPQDAENHLALNKAQLAEEIERRMESMLGKVEVVSDAQAFPLSGLVAKRFGKGPVALVGEAGHVFPPIGAQGFNLGIRDIELLTGLAAGKTGEQLAHLGDEYHRRRSADVASRGVSIDLLNRSLLSDFLPVQMARSAGLSLVGSIGPLRRFIMREGVAPGGQAKALLDRLRAG